MGLSKEQLLARLKELQVDFSQYEHPVVLTVEAQAKYVGNLGGGLGKNLFLKDKKSRFYIVSALADTKVDLKAMSLCCWITNLKVRSGASSTLYRMTCQSIRDEISVSLSTHDLDKFLKSIGRDPSYVDLEANPLVGKDQPPDLACFVPSGSTVLPDPLQPATSSKGRVEIQVSVDKKSTASTVNSSKPSISAKRTTGKQVNGVNVTKTVTDVQSWLKIYLIEHLLYCFQRSPRRLLQNMKDNWELRYQIVSEADCEKILRQPL